MTKIIFNGKTYDTPDEMSATDRAAFEQIAVMFGDKNGNGIPDFLEGDIIKNVSTAYTNIVNINGHVGMCRRPLSGGAVARSDDSIGPRATRTTGM